MKEDLSFTENKNKKIIDKKLFTDNEVQNFINNSSILENKNIPKNEYSGTNKPWKVLIVDDEADIHKVTKLNLGNFALKGQKLHFFHAFSGKEAEDVFVAENEIALVFLDVVMETNHAGLDFIKFIREKQKNDIAQIILYTGQPGQAPEKEVISKYDINDYQTKTELTENKLFTITATSLRTFEALKKIKNYNKELEQKVAERTKNLQMALNTKDKLFSIIAHDLKNPFSSILGFSDLLNRHSEKFNIDEILKFSKTINDTAKDVYKLLSDLLDWARAQNKTIQVKPIKLKVFELINEVLTLYQAQINSKSINIQLEVDEETVAFADEEMTKTVIRNLISNAVKFTEKGFINIKTIKENGSCKISVIDSGTGFNAEVLKKQIAENKNSPTKGTRKEKGTGIGLLICKEFAKLNNGSLSFSSKPNKGSEFYFTLPANNNS